MAGARDPGARRLRVEIIGLKGPLEADRLGWVAELYGRADAKYGRVELLEHLLVKGPAGPALHVFALDDGRPVAHCAVVPMRARRGAHELRCGKVEALFVDDAYRGRRPGAQPVVLAVLDRLYALAEEDGIELLHAYVRPAVGRVFLGFERLDVGERTLVVVTSPRTLGSRALRAQGAALALAQGLARGAAHAIARTLARSEAVTLRAPTATDADLAEAPRPARGRWTVLAFDSWSWYCASPLLRVLEIHGSHASRALVQLAGSPGDPVRVIGWRPERTGLAPAVLLLCEAARLARRGRAGTVRFQPWPASAGDGALRRACRLLGFVPRDDFTTLYVRSRDPELARPEAVVPTPSLYLGF